MIVDSEWDTADTSVQYDAPYVKHVWVFTPVLPEQQGAREVLAAVLVLILASWERQVSNYPGCPCEGLAWSNLHHQATP